MRKGHHTYSSLGCPKCGKVHIPPMQGKHHTLESKKKIGQAHQGQKGPMLGKHHTSESRKEIDMPPHVLVLGATGMLGSAVTKKLVGSCKYRVTATCRAGAWDTLKDAFPEDLLCHKKFFSPENFVLGNGSYSSPSMPWSADVIVNCIGIVKPAIAKVGIEQTVLVNSLFPHVLARFCSSHHISLIHITTDCVYSGTKGWYDETAVHDCDDVYGKSKSLGEPFDDAMVLRTSIIGPEIHNFTSLVSWAQSQAGKTVNGFTNHQWNGITTGMYGEIIDRIIDQDLWSPGLYHVFSPRPVTKFELLQRIDQRYDLHMNIVPTEASVAVNRTLASVHEFNNLLHLPNLEEQIKEM